jgi:hypothetical protein
MNKNNEPSWRGLNAETSGNMLPGRGISPNQEGELLKDAFLVSSAIEILTTSTMEKKPLRPKEQKLFSDLADLTEKLQKADAFLSREETQLMLQPEGVELAATIRKEGGQEISKRIKVALQLLQRINEDKALPVENKRQVNDLADFLRKLLRGIKVRLSEEDGPPRTLLFD